jgi:hypothetical protein
MSIGTQEPSHVRVTTGDVDLPVEVRDSRMRLVDQGLSGWSPIDHLHGRDLHLDPGTYVVSVRLPGGRTFAEAVQLQSGHNQPVDLRPEIEWLLPKVRYPSAGISVSEPPYVDRIDHPRRWAYRFLRLRGLRQVSPLPFDRFAPVPESVPGSRTFEVDMRWRGVSFVQLAYPAAIPLNVAFLPGNATLLTVKEQAGTIHAAILPGGELVGRAAQFLAAGENEHAALLLSSDEAESLLQDKIADPIGAAIGGYALLRLNELERTHDWTENLSSWFDWLPDGAVIAGEKAARRGNHAPALHNFVLAGQRGLPLFTDGFSILVSRLHQYTSTARILNHLTSEQVAEAQALLTQLERWSPFVDFTALTLTFRAASLTDPGQFQHSVEIDERFIPRPLR